MEGNRIKTEEVSEKEESFQAEGLNREAGMEATGTSGPQNLLDQVTGD